MSKRVKLAAAIGAALLAVYLLTALHRHREPTYNGLTMSQWLRSLDYAQQKEALLILGTSNLPLLVKLLTYDREKDLVYRVIECLPDRIRYSPRIYGIASQRSHLADEALTVFRTLGARASPVIPQLAAAVNQGGYPSERALTTLSLLGDEGLAIVATQAAHSNTEMRLFAVGLLGEHIESPISRLALTNALNDPDRQVHQTAWYLITNR